MLSRNKDLQWAVISKSLKKLGLSANTMLSINKDLQLAVLSKSVKKLGLSANTIPPPMLSRNKYLQWAVISKSLKKILIFNPPQHKFIIHFNVNLKQNSQVCIHLELSSQIDSTEVCHKTLDLFLNKTAPPTADKNQIN